MSLGVKHKLSHAIAALVAVSMAACSNIYQKQQLATHNTVSPAKKLAIFFDGTANNVESDTNVKRLHSLAAMLMLTKEEQTEHRRTSGESGDGWNGSG